MCPVLYQLDKVMDELIAGIGSTPPVFSQDSQGFAQHSAQSEATERERPRRNSGSKPPTRPVSANILSHDGLANFFGMTCIEGFCVCGFVCAFDMSGNSLVSKDGLSSIFGMASIEDVCAICT
jgi:hypothetical protein